MKIEESSTNDRRKRCLTHRFTVSITTLRYLRNHTRVSSSISVGCAPLSVARLRQSYRQTRDLFTSNLPALFLHRYRFHLVDNSPIEHWGVVPRYRSFR